MRFSLLPNKIVSRKFLIVKNNNPSTAYCDHFGNQMTEHRNQMITILNGKLMKVMSDLRLGQRG